MLSIINLNMEVDLKKADREEVVLRLIREGLTPKEICQQVKLNLTSYYRIAKKHDVFVPIKRVSVHLRLDVKEFKIMWDSEDYTVSDIADAYRMSQTQVYSFAKYHKLNSKTTKNRFSLRLKNRKKNGPKPRGEKIYSNPVGNQKIFSECRNHSCVNILDVYDKKTGEPICCGNPVKDRSSYCQSCHKLFYVLSTYQNS